MLYVQTPRESSDNIGLAAQRHLINNFKLATQLGAQVLKVKNDNVARTIWQTAQKYDVTTICMGKPHFTLLQIIVNTAVFAQLLKKLTDTDIDLIILS